MLSDLRHSLRTLLASPSFLLLTVATLAAGIASTTAIFSLFYQVLMRSLPVPSPEELVVLNSPPPDLPGSSSSDHSMSVFSYPMYLQLSSPTASMHGLAARSAATVLVARNKTVDRMRTEVVSGNFFDVLGVKPRLGRLLTPADDSVRGGNRVAVLNHDAWVAKFASDPAVIGRNLLVNSEPFEIIGVAAEGFRGVLTGSKPDLFVPISMKASLSPGWKDFDRPDSRWLALIGRVNGSRESAQSALQARFTATLREQIASMNIKSESARQRLAAKTLELRPAQQGLNEFEKQWRRPLVVLMAMVGLLLAIACANLANLFLARALGRSRELAVRMALGAGRTRAAFLLVWESFVVAVLGTIAGIALAPALIRLLLRSLNAGAFEGWVTSALSIPVLLFTCAVMFTAALVFGAVPAWEATRSLTVGVSERAGAGRIRASLRKGLVCAQVALSVLLLAGAGLFAKSFLNLLRANPGFEPAQLIAITVDPTPAHYSPERGVQFYRDLRERWSSLPGVESVSVAEASPFAFSSSSSNVAVEGYQAKPDENTDVNRNAVGPGYFRTMGTALRGGREFTEADIPGAPKVAIVNEAFVRRFFAPGVNVTGKRMSIGQGGPLDLEIVGVAANSKHLNMRETIAPMLFTPHAQEMGRVRSAAMFVRMRGAATGFGETARAALRQIEPTALFVSIRPMEQRIRETMTTDTLIAGISSAFAIFALLLTALGLYGVIAYLVRRRTVEFGIRMALGAVRSRILALVMGEVALLAAAGALIGLAVFAATGRIVESQLFGLGSFDLTVLAAVFGLLAIVIAAAGLIPALRAAAVQPVEALRSE
ncbi:MAG: ABC transporter permease [Bryobacteraceae bacterium]